ncbi:TPA: hypothetical protein QCI16_004206 [Enterobacter ludwigii]|nr:hypothetical protein [Enterobacter ludwigii]HDR2600002.1 hypothetical protein [Enterobacter ludwigii]
MTIALKMTAVTVLMAVGISTALAGTDAHVDITGNVTPVSCNLGPGVAAVKNIFLGNAAPGDFQKGGGGALYARLYTVPASLHAFPVTVDGCAGVAPVKDSELLVRVNANGNIVGTSADKLFGGGYGQQSSAGATLAAKDRPGLRGVKTLLGDGDEVVAYIYKDNENASAANGSTVLFETMMASTGQRPAPGGIDAPITFTVDYK